MKKLIIVLVFLAVISPVFAQNNSDDSKKGKSNVYYLTVTIEKIWLAGTGYVVQYRKSSTQIGTIGIPYNWFTSPDSAAEMVLLPKGPNWPYMSVFYIDGKFSHIRLYPHWQKSHQTWGVTPLGADVSRHFQEKDAFKFDY